MEEFSKIDVVGGGGTRNYKTRSLTFSVNKDEGKDKFHENCTFPINRKTSFGLKTITMLASLFEYFSEIFTQFHQEFKTFSHYSRDGAIGSIASY